MTRTARVSAGLIAVAALTIVVPACGESPTSPSDLTGGTWRLVAIEPVTGPSIAVTDGSRYWIEFVSETQISARADCNSCSGSYTLSGTTVTIGPLACTRAFCGETSLDTPFTQGLTEARELTLDEQLLQIKSPTTTLKFRAQ
jgi:heat shock protein HslJ